MLRNERCIEYGYQKAQECNPRTPKLIHADYDENAIPKKNTKNNSK